MASLQTKPWWNYLTENQKDLLVESFELLEREKEESKDRFHDYAFIVFPAAKAYEGFLKKLFLDLGFISKKDYYGRRFRIGRALNPALEKRYRRESVYDRLAKFCQGKDLPDYLWQTWKRSRNLLFHWFPQHKNFVSLPQAEKRLGLITSAIDQAFKECKIKREG